MKSLQKNSNTHKVQGKKLFFRSVDADSAFRIKNPVDVLATTEPPQPGDVVIVSCGIPGMEVDGVTFSGRLYTIKTLTPYRVLLFPATGVETVDDIDPVPESERGGYEVALPLDVYKVLMILF